MIRSLSNRIFQPWSRRELNAVNVATILQRAGRARLALPAPVLAYLAAALEAGLDDVPTRVKLKVGPTWADLEDL